MNNLQQNLFKLAYEISPIILTGGVARLSGNYLPIVAITEVANFTLGLLNGRSPINLDNFFAHFKPVSGSTLIDNEVGDYPFANQSVAANAIIARPKKISMLMLCPAKGSGAYVSKLATFTALKDILDSHNQSGGTYIVATPAYMYTNCIMTTMIDVSTSDTKQVQNAYQFDFVQPLITLNQTQEVLNTLMSKLNGGLPTSTLISGITNTIDNVVSITNSITNQTSIGGSIANPIKNP
jgi:hypothetical protein